jgi:hypothetical protein
MDVIFDIDGTLLNIEHRLKFIKKSPKDWEGFRDPKQKHWDEPIRPMLDLFTSLYLGGDNVILCSGRCQSEEADTRASLASLLQTDFVLDDANVPGYFRPDKDRREDSIIKSEALDQMLSDKFSPTLVFDDRPSVIRMWRDRGLKVADVGYGEEF